MTLLRELQTQLTAHMSDWQELIDLLNRSGIDPSKYTIDHESNVQATIPALMGEINHREPTLLPLARTLKQTNKNVRFSVAVSLEIRTGYDATALRTGAFFAAFLVLCAAFAAGLLLALDILAEARWPEGYVDAQLSLHGDDIYVRFKADEAFAKQPVGELVFVPIRKRRPEVYAVCHLAALSVAVHRTGEVTPGELIETKVVDLEPGSEDCQLNDAKDILRFGWSVTAEVSRYPGTYRLRARRANERATQLGGQGAEHRTEREILYNDALAAKRAALKIYHEGEGFRKSSANKVDAMIAQLEDELTDQEFLVNSVTSTPKHEMVFVSSSESRSWSESGEGKLLHLGGFWIDRFEVSRHQFARSTRSEDGLRDPTPILGVDWSEAETYCKRTVDGRSVLRLPTDAEYEKVATWDPKSKRARPWPWGFGPVDVGTRRWRTLGPVQQLIEPDISAYNVINLVSSAAEWTTRHVIRTLGDAGVLDHDVVIKGGSYRAESEAKIKPTRPRLATDENNSDVGFRCASTEQPEGVLLRPQ
jgi:hypothetical protein